MAMKVDVIIVGAGLAGLSAANEIASRSRASVVVIERLVIGSNNPTPMTFIDVIGRFGLEDCITGRYNQFTFHSPLGNQSTHSFGEIQLVALAYRRACLKLLDMASTAGNVWMYSASAVGLDRQEKDWLMTLNDGRQISASLVIDASGRGLFASRALHLARPRSYSHCYGAHLSNCAIPNPQQAFFFAPHPDYGDGGGWLYPLDDHRASFGFATLGNSPSLPGGTVKANFNRALENFEPYATWLKGAAWEHVEVGSIPIYPLRKFVYDGLLITGDAAGQATIWSCMGSEAALVSGQMAGYAALTALLRGDFSTRTLGQYQSQWDSLYRETYQHNAWIGPTMWSQSAEDWNRQIPLLSRLTPDQMLARLRINWPIPSLPQAVFIRSYDLAGRTRRQFARQLQGLLAPSRPVSSQPISGQDE